MEKIIPILSAAQVLGFAKSSPRGLDGDNVDLMFDGVSLKAAYLNLLECVTQAQAILDLKERNLEKLDDIANVLRLHGFAVRLELLGLHPERLEKENGKTK